MVANEMNGDSEVSSKASSPERASESRGSSVSTGLREEYEDLLRYAVVTPVVGLPGKPHPSTMSPRPQSPPQPTARGPHQPQGL